MDNYAKLEKVGEGVSFSSFLGTYLDLYYDPRNVWRGLQSTRHHDKRNRRAEEDQVGGGRRGSSIHSDSGDQLTEGAQGRQRCEVRERLILRVERVEASLWLQRLLDIVHADQKLYLVFEFLDMDLKRYMESGNSRGEPITLDTVKVCLIPHAFNTPLIRAAVARNSHTN